jgi:superfamily II DNA or RNA helicase
MIEDIRAAWAGGAANVCAQLPTGGGKTVVFSEIIRAHNGRSVAIAHRAELVSQMSLTFGRAGVRHRIIAPRAALQEIVSLHMAVLGRNWHDPHAAAAAASVDTLVRRDRDEQMTLWVQDEGHHLLRANKWGRALDLFPNARGLAVTATPGRADGKGLGRHADGLLDVLICGPTPRDLIEQGYLTDYRIFAPKSDIDLASVPVSDTTGDFQQPALREAAKRSHITGDLVESYRRIAAGKLGVTFCVSVDLASETAAQFRAAGVPAECVSADTPALMRAAIIRRFAAREVLQLVNVDLFGEGFDLPAIEVVSMGRPTQSYGLYAQQFGRALRPMPGKAHAIIIDHAGNVLRHGLPDAPRAWSLDRRDRRAKSAQDGELQVRACPACTGVYERFRRLCPYCGHVPVPAGRTAPEMVDGDLLELDPAVLAMLRRDIARLDDQPLIPHWATAEIRGAILKRHRQRQLAQAALREAIAQWAGYQRAAGLEDGEIYRRFYLSWELDIATAQTLGSKDAVALTAKVRGATR